jgi:hypothetical protein
MSSYLENEDLDQPATNQATILSIGARQKTKT